MPSTSRRPSVFTPVSYTHLAAITTARLLDLVSKPLSEDRALWADLTDYSHCQAFAAAALAADGEVIRYASVRDPGQGANLAILQCRAFSQPAPIERQTWRIRLSHSGVRALCEFPRQAIEFPRQAFAAAPRIAALNWVR